MGRLQDVLRSMFGLPKESIGPDDLPRNIHEDFQQEFGHNFEHRGPFRPHPPYPPSDSWIPQGDHPMPDEFVIIQGPDGADMFGDIEQMFNDFFQGFGFGHHEGGEPPNFFSGPFIGPPGSPSEDLATPPGNDEESIREVPSHGGSLRDKMLKRPGEEHSIPHPYQAPDKNDDFPQGFGSPHSWFGGLWKSPFRGLPSPQDQVDRDLDSEVENGQQSIDDILSSKQDPTPTPNRSRGPSMSSSSSFSSIITIDSNGRRESKTTCRDSTGNEEVTVTRRIGDQEHTVTHRKDISGAEQTEENLHNIVQGDLSEFNDKWNTPQRCMKRI